MKRFVDYVRGGKVFVVTDHESLRWMESATDGKVQRWCLYLQQYDLTLLHINGEFNVVADWLSRSLSDDEEQDSIIEEVSTPLFMVSDDRPKATSAPSSAVVSSSIWTPYVPTVEEFKRCYEDLSANEKRVLFLAPDEMYYHLRTRRLYVPLALRDCVLYWFHVSKFGGHCGVNKTVRRMKKWVWWNKMAQDVQAYMGQYLICIRSMTPQPVRRLQSVLSKPLPFQTVSLDFIGPVSWCSVACYALVCIDHATRFIVGVHCGNSALAAVEVLRFRWCSMFQAPNVVLTDRGSHFLGAFNEFVTRELLSYHVFTSPYYPQGNAINEAAHKAINRVLCGSALLSDCDFKSALESAVSVHNATLILR